MHLSFLGASLLCNFFAEYSDLLREKGVIGRKLLATVFGPLARLHALIDISL